MPTIILAVTWVINVLALPETLYVRDPQSGHSLKYTPSKLRLFGFRASASRRHVRLADFTNTFKLFKYPPVLLSVIYYSYAFGIGSIMFAITGAAAFGSTYDFNTAQVGMAVGIPFSIGPFLGELASGPVSDWCLLRADKRHDGKAPPEARLHAMWPGMFLLPAGVIIEGVTLRYKTHWMGPVMGIGIGGLGQQILSTNIYAYLADCYRPQSSQISTLLNFGRYTFSFTLGFYMVSNSFLSFFLSFFFFFFSYADAALHRFRLRKARRMRRRGL